MSHSGIARRVARTRDIPNFDEARFFSHVSLASNTCWIWGAKRNPDGYGQFHIRDTDGKWRLYGAHRVSYTIAHGPIPEGMVIDHLCRNRSCVNPGHLEAVTIQVNTARGCSAVAAAAASWAEGRCRNGHDLAKVGIHKSGKAWTCAQCGRDRVARYKARKRAS